MHVHTATLSTEHTRETHTRWGAGARHTRRARKSGAHGMISLHSEFGTPHLTQGAGGTTDLLWRMRTTDTMMLLRIYGHASGTRNRHPPGAVPKRAWSGVGAMQQCGR
eukprot:7380049-Prymnesium_polylepis.1